MPRHAKTLGPGRIDPLGRRCESKERDPSLPWSEMRGLPNIVAHAYHRVDPARAWQVVPRDLPETQEKIQALLEEVQEER